MIRFAAMDHAVRIRERFNVGLSRGRFALLASTLLLAVALVVELVHWHDDYPARANGGRSGGAQHSRTIAEAPDSEWQLLLLLALTAGCLALAWHGLAAELADTRRRLHESQRLAMLGNWEWHIANGRLAWSPEIFRIFGTDQRDFGATYESFLARVYPDDRPLVERSVRAALDKDAPFSIDYRIVRPNGVVRVVHAEGKVFRQRNGAPARMIGTVQDLTESKSVEDAERRSRALLSGILNVAEDAVVATDDRMRIILFNRGAEEIFGYAAAEALGASIDLLIPQRFRHVHGAHVAAFGAGDRRSLLMGQRREIVALRRNGSEFPAEASVSKLVNDAGTTYTVFLRDITKRKHDAEALLAAKFQAEHANRAKSQFLANMSHELRTPLNAIIGFAELMRQELLGPIGTPRYRDYLRDIGDSGAHLVELINDILDLSKVEAGQATLQESEFEVAALTDSALRLVSALAESAGVTLTSDLPGEPVCLHGDLVKLNQILINLLTNAVKFTLTGGNVHLGVSRQDDGGVLFQVADTGIGIEAGDIPLVMTPFAQARNGMTRSKDGIGLGLPLSKALAELHGGTLTLSSVVGRGTTASLLLPPTRVLKGP